MKGIERIILRPFGNFPVNNDVSVLDFPVRLIMDKALDLVMFRNGGRDELQ